MDTKSKIIFIGTLGLLFLSVSATYYRFIILKDYESNFDNYDETEEVTGSVDN